MKKFLLVAVAALAVVACKKDEDEPVNPNGGNGNGNGGAQTEQPTPVPAGFVKTIQKAGNNGSYTYTETTTYNVVNNVLKGWVIDYQATGGSQPSGITTHTLQYDGNKLKTYVQDLGTYSTTFEFSYTNNKLTKIVRKEYEPYNSYTVTTDTQGRVTKLENKVADGSDREVWEANIAYNGTTISLSLNSQSYGVSTATYTFEGDNVKKLQKGSETIDYQFDGTVVNVLNNEYLFLTHLAQEFYRGSFQTVGGLNDLFVNYKSKNIVKKDAYYNYEVTEKEGTNKPKTVVKKLTGASTPEGTIKYTYY